MLVVVLKSMINRGNMKYYAVFPDYSFIEYENLNDAIRSSPEFIIGRAYRGTYDQTFPERHVVDEHYYISFYEGDGKKKELVKNGWKVLDIDDPVRYNTHIHIKISDPNGDIRIFDKFRVDCHYSIKFRNTIDGDGLISLYRYFMDLANNESWEYVEKEEGRHWTPRGGFSKGNLHKDYFDERTKSYPNREPINNGKA